MGKHDFISLYRSIVEGGFKSKPTVDADNGKFSSDSDIDQVWNGISDQLDIDEVWDGISKELIRRDRKMLFVKIGSLAAAVFFLGGLFIYRDKPPVEPLEQGEIIGHLIDSVDTNTADSPIIAGKYLDSSVNADAAILNKTNEKEKSGVTGLPTQTDARELLSVSSYEPETYEGRLANQPDAGQSKLSSFPLQLSIPQVGMHYFAPVIPERKFEDPHFLPVQKSKIEKYSPENVYEKRWSLAAVSAFQSAYMVNRETIEGFESSGMNKSHLNLNSNIGFELGYLLRYNWQVAATGFVNSSVKQSFSQYHHGKYVGKEMKFSYLTGELSIRYQARKSPILNRYLNTKTTLGMYGSYMQRARLDIDGKSEDVLNRYKRYDYGFVLGQDFETKLNGPVNFVAGLRIRGGLPNIYKGDKSSPEMIDHTRNLSAEIRVGMLLQWGRVYRPGNRMMAYTDY